MDIYIFLYNFLSISYIIETSDKHSSADYFVPNKGKDIPSCCGDDHVYSLKDKACISLDGDRTLQPFTGCGEDNDTIITLVTNIQVGL